MKCYTDTKINERKNQLKILIGAHTQIVKTKLARIECWINLDKLNPV